MTGYQHQHLTERCHRNLHVGQDVDFSDIISFISAIIILGVLTLFNLAAYCIVFNLRRTLSQVMDLFVCIFCDFILPNIFVQFWLKFLFHNLVFRSTFHSQLINKQTLFEVLMIRGVRNKKTRNCSFPTLRVSICLMHTRSSLSTLSKACFQLRKGFKLVFALKIAFLTVTRYSQFKM